MFFQHNRTREDELRGQAYFTSRCLERQMDPGRISNAPHILQLISGEVVHTPLTLFSFDLTVTPTFCFLKHLKERYPVRAKFTEADGYLFLDVALDYIDTEVRAMYKKERVVISSEIRHFAELAAKKGFRITKRLYNGEAAGWRAIK